jgi:DNA-binding protein HU-beta
VSEDRSERFYSKGFAGVTVIKGKGDGSPLLAERQTSGREYRVVVKSHRAVGKTELVSEVADAAGLSRVQASKAVDGVVEAISAALADGEIVRVTGFGTFSVTRRKALTGRNPRTGKPIAIAEAVTPRFKAGKQLRDAVN